MKTGASKISRWLSPIALLGLLWWILTKGEPGSWVVGLPAIALALFAYGRLVGRRRAGLRIGELPGFAVWFLWRSLIGGVDVARRALRPRLSLNAGLLRYRLTIPPGPQRVFLVNCVSLLPGTLSADVRDDDLLLHALDTRGKIIDETRLAERRVQRLFAVATGVEHA